MSSRAALGLAGQEAYPTLLAGVAGAAAAFQNVSDLFYQDPRGKGLLEECDFLLQNAAVHDGAIGVSRHVDHFEVGPAADQLFGELAPAHLGHDYIGDQEVNSSTEPVGDAPGFERVGRVQNLVSV